MKRLLLVLLTLMIIVLPCLASASEAISSNSNELSDLEKLQLQLQKVKQIYAGDTNSAEIHRALDQVVLPITLYQDTADGRVELGSYELPIIEITYRYILFVSEQLGYTGGCFDFEDYPIYETSQDYINICGIEAQISVEDFDLKIEAGRNKCAVYVTGGDIEITYANEIVFDQYGQMTESNETTVHVQHNFKAVHELPEGYIEK